MANEDMSGCDFWRAKDLILSALALLDERGINRDVSLAMAIVQEGFDVSVKDESVGPFELLQRARWADGIADSNGAEGKDHH